MTDPVIVVGAGFAGCEAAWLLAEHGIPVRLYEMKPVRYSPAHEREGFAELVCSNSFKAIRPESAAGLLKEEMRLLGSILLPCADLHQVPAGGALAVDRNAFSDEVTRRISAHPGIEIIREEVTDIPEGEAILATGPLTSDALAESIRALCGGALSFYDAAAPIITADSIDMGKAFFASRYDRGDEEDYINCPFDKEEYQLFYDALVCAEKAATHNLDKDERVYEGCMPIEVMAKRGADTMRFGPLRPVGLRDPRTDKRPWAVVQLRRENTQGSLYNIVGFQTNLKFAEQKKVFSLIPGLENLEIVRYGVMHRNTFIDSPRLLDETFRFRSRSNLYFAGQITGVEGYMESALSGLVAAHAILRRREGHSPYEFGPDTMTGSLTRYISDPSVKDFQPMGANMGILAPLTERIKGKQARYAVLAQRANSSMKHTLDR